MKKEPRTITCILCPNSCTLRVTFKKDRIHVSGNGCVRGEGYGREEVTAPRRIVTAVVNTTSQEWPCVPVKSVEPIEKRKIPALLNKLYTLRIDLPVRRGEALDLTGFDTTVVFTRSLPPEKI